MTRSLILLAHGSPDPRHADSVTRIASLVSRELGSGWTVRTSYLQHHGPTVTEEFEAALQSDELPVSIQPLLLTAGEHWRDDVPALTNEATANPKVDLLDPLEPVELLPAVLEALETPSTTEDPHNAAGAPRTAPTPGSGGSPRPASSANSATMPVRNIVLVAGGSRIQDLRQHFQPLAAVVGRVLEQTGSDKDCARTQPVCVDLLTRPAQISKLRYSGPPVQIVPLLVSPGRIHDAILHEARKVDARVTVPIGQTDAFARAVAARALAQRAPLPQDHRHRV